jgi:hypothetical protein
MSAQITSHIQAALHSRGLKTEMPQDSKQCPGIVYVHVVVGDFTVKCYSVEDARDASFDPPVEDFFRLASKLDFKRFYSFARDASEAWWAAYRQDPFSVTGRIFRTGNQEFTLLAEIEDCRPEVVPKGSDFRRVWTYQSPLAFSELDEIKSHLQAIETPNFQPQTARPPVSASSPASQPKQHELALFL